MDFTEFVTQTPAIGAILLIVMWNHKATAKRDCALKDISKVMQESSKVVGQNSELLREVTTILRAINGNAKRLLRD